MKDLKSHFWYNKRQRNGILFLVLLIIVLQAVLYFMDFGTTKLEVLHPETEAIQKQIDSVKELKQAENKFKIRPFNPNYITDFKAYQLGMSVGEIDRLFAFRKTGKFVNSAKEFQNITHINDSLLKIISPYFKFPDWVNSKPKKEIPKKNIPNHNITVSSFDLNKVTTEDLQTINGVGEKLANRIISYRKLLQGFSTNEQLYEVYYLDKVVADKILVEFSVQQLPNIKKLNINTATFKQMVNLPYIDYPLTKKIFRYKNEVEHIYELDELKKIDSFPVDKYARIALYLTTN